MKKPSDLLVYDQEVESLRLRVSRLERTTAALSARMAQLFGTPPKQVDLAADAAAPAIMPAIR